MQIVVFVLLARMQTKKCFSRKGFLGLMSWGRGMRIAAPVCALARNDKTGSGHVIRLNCFSICFFDMTVQMGLPWGQYFRSSLVRTASASLRSSTGSVT